MSSMGKLKVILLRLFHEENATAIVGAAGEALSELERLDGQSRDFQREIDRLEDAAKEAFGGWKAANERTDKLETALSEALVVIDDYLDYRHDGDPWTEDARQMGEMRINDYGRDGSLTAAKALLAGASE